MAGPDSPDTRIYDIGNALMNNIPPALVNADIEVPSRKVLTSGAFALDFAGEDCASSFVVSFQGLLGGQSNTMVPGTSLRYAVPIISQWAIGLFRCVSILNEEGEAPEDTVIADDFSELSQDAMTLPRVIVDLAQTGELLADYVEAPGCGEFGLGGVQTYGPSGGVGGVVLTLYVSLV